MIFSPKLFSRPNVFPHTSASKAAYAQPPWEVWLAVRVPQMIYHPNDFLAQMFSSPKCFPPPNAFIQIKLIPPRMFSYPKCFPPPGPIESLLQLNLHPLMLSPSGQIKYFLPQIAFLPQILSQPPNFFPPQMFSSINISPSGPIKSFIP